MKRESGNGGKGLFCSFKQIYAAAKQNRFEISYVHLQLIMLAV